MPTELTDNIVKNWYDDPEAVDDNSRYVHRNWTDPPLRAIVGPTRVPVFFHKSALLSLDSDFFSALANSDINVSEQVLDWTEFDLDTIRAVLSTAYVGIYEASLPNGDEADEEPDEMAALVASLTSTDPWPPRTQNLDQSGENALAEGAESTSKASLVQRLTMEEALARTRNMKPDVFGCFVSEAGDRLGYVVGPEGAPPECNDWHLLRHCGPYSGGDGSIILHNGFVSKYRVQLDNYPNYAAEAEAQRVNAGRAREIMLHCKVNIFAIHFQCRQLTRYSSTMLKSSMMIPTMWTKTDETKVISAVLNAIPMVYTKTNQYLVEECSAKAILMKYLATTTRELASRSQQLFILDDPRLHQHEDIMKDLVRKLVKVSLDREKFERKMFPRMGPPGIPPPLRKQQLDERSVVESSEEEEEDEKEKEEDDEKEEEGEEEEEVQEEA